MPPPLTKTNAKGECYRRRPNVDTLIDEVAVLDRVRLLERLSITNRGDPAYLPSEVLLHVLRATRHDNRDSYFERLFRLLLKRVHASLHGAVRDTQYRNASEIRDEIASRLSTLIARDRGEAGDRLDAFEAMFDGAMATLRIDVLRKLGPQRLKTDPIEDEATGEISARVEDAASDFLGQARDNFDDPTFRSELSAAIDTLPDDEKTVIVLLLQGIPIDGKEADSVTIAKMLACCERTVRNRRDRAVDKLRRALQGEYAS